MKKITLLIITSMCSLNLFSQNQDCSEFLQWNIGMTFRIDAGTFIPLDNFKSTVGVSPHIGLYFGFPITKGYRIDLGTSLFIPLNVNRIEYLLPDTVLTGKAILSGTMGIWASRVQELRKCWFFDSRLGTGLGFFQTDIPTNKPKEENDSVYGAETVFLCLGGSIRKVIFTKRSIGLSANYYFVPYNAFEKNFKSNFGSQYLTLSTCYTF